MNTGPHTVIGPIYSSNPSAVQNNKNFYRVSSSIPPQPMAVEDFGSSLILNNDILFITIDLIM